MLSENSLVLAWVSISLSSKQGTSFSRDEHGRFQQRRSKRHTHRGHAAFPPRVVPDILRLQKHGCRAPQGERARCGPRLGRSSRACQHGGYAAVILV